MTRRRRRNAYSPAALGCGLLALTLLLSQGAAAQRPDTGVLHALEARVDSLRAAGAPVELATLSRELAETRNAHGLYHFTNARFDSAVAHYRRALELFIEVGDVAEQGRVYNNIGAAYYQWGNYEPALDAFLSARALRREGGHVRGETLALTNIGRIYHDWHQYDRARAAYDEALALGESLDDPFVVGYALHNQGVLEFNQGDYGRSRALLEASIRSYEDLRLGEEGRGIGFALNMVYLGRIHVREGDIDEGIAVLERVLALAMAEDKPRRKARALIHLGEAYRARGEPDRAVAAFEHALTVARAADQRPLATDALAGVAAAHEDRGDAPAALARFRAYHALSDSIFDQSAVQRIAAMESRAEADQQQRENARLREEQRVTEAVIARQRLVGLLGAALLLVSATLVGTLIRYNRLGRRRARQLAGANTELTSTNRELKAALSEVRTLKGLIPICGHCKKVRDDEGFWEAVESYISNRSEALFSHSICNDCGPRVYGDDWAKPATPVHHGGADGPTGAADPADPDRE